MKKMIITMSLVAHSLVSTIAFSQCANTTGNYEFSISNDAKSITIKARNTSATIRSTYINPAINGNFVGLVFGIKWSSESDIVLHQNNSVLPFDIVKSGGVELKTNFNFQSYGDEAKELPILSKEFMNGDWHIITTIPYTGSLANGDKFELIECGFDETTNPYSAQMDKEGNFGQFAPNLIRNATQGANLSIANAVIVYPNPTSGNLFIDVSSSIMTRAMFKVTDMTGKTVKTIQSELVEGVNKIIVNVDELASGLYLIKVSDGKALNYSQTFSKQ